MRQYIQTTPGAAKTRTEVKIHVIAKNKDIPVYGVSIPRHIALQFLGFDKMSIDISGAAIILVPFHNKKPGDVLVTTTQ